MKPGIDSTAFGAITIDGKRIDHDVVIRLSGAVKKRKKALSKAVYGTSHIVSGAEADYLVEPGAERLIVGTGQYGRVVLSDEAAAHLAARKIAVDLAPTPAAIALWNEARGRVIGLFHVTC